MHKPRAAIFDLDETLTAAKQPMSFDMARQLSKLAVKLPIGIISGATYERMSAQVLPYLPSKIYPNITLIPTSGASMYQYIAGKWSPLYNYKIDAKEAKRIARILTRTAKESGFLEGWPVFGPRVEFRGSQVTLSALGQNAPYEEKVKWDRDKKKRRYICKFLKGKLPEYDVSFGGKTSIDVVPKGVNKALGVRNFCRFKKLQPQEVLYIGDDLGPGGNDSVVKETRVRTMSVSGPRDTLREISTLIKKLHLT